MKVNEDYLSEDKYRLRAKGERKIEEDQYNFLPHPLYVAALPVCGGRTVCALVQNIISTYGEWKVILFCERKSYKHIILGVKNDV